MFVTVQLTPVAAAARPEKPKVVYDKPAPNSQSGTSPRASNQR